MIEDTGVEDRLTKTKVHEESLYKSTSVYMLIILQYKKEHLILSILHGWKTLIPMDMII